MNNDMNNNLGSVIGGNTSIGSVDPKNTTSMPEGSQVIMASPVDNQQVLQSSPVTEAPVQPTQVVAPTPAGTVDQLNPTPQAAPMPGLAPAPQPPVTPAPAPSSNIPQASEIISNPPIGQVSPAAGSPLGNPAPAYTNPNTINPIPGTMPGFEPSSAIGTTPPISLEKEKEPKKKMNKTLFIVLIIVILVAVGFGTYYVLNYTDLLKGKAQVTIVTKDFQLDVGSELPNDISSYATITGTDNKNCSLNTQDVDVSNAGVYTYKVTCGETIKAGKITVIPVEKTEIVLKPVYKLKGATLSASEFVENSSDDLQVEFVDAESSSTLTNSDNGKYLVQLKVTDSNSNITNAVGTLIVTDSEIKGFVTCTTNSQAVDGTSAVMTLTNKFAILSNDNKYGNIAEEIYTYKYSDSTEFEKVVNEYKEDGTININSVTGSVSYDSTENTITITNDLDNSKVISDFGASNMVNYRSIMTYFGTTRGYNCTYQKND